jgi:predicted ferric reductase
MPGLARRTANEKSTDNFNFSLVLLLVLAATLASLALWTLLVASHRWLRRLSSLHDSRQNYWVLPSARYAAFKQHLLYAPILRKRHNRELQLSAAVNIGTLPTRFQLLLILAYAVLSITLCFVQIDYSSKSTLTWDTIRKRSGILALVNMLPLFIMAGRNNPLIHLVGLSFAGFNLLHRWLGRLVVLQMLIHFFSWLYPTVSAQGWTYTGKHIFGSQMLVFGLIVSRDFPSMLLAIARLTIQTVCSAVAILVQSLSPLRHAFYETFKKIHLLLVFAVVAVLWMHVGLADREQQKYLIVAICIWSLERTTRIGRITWRNIGRGGSSATVQALPGNAARVTVQLVRPWTFKPGQHAYLYIPGLAYGGHPFSVAWSDSGENLSDKESLAPSYQDVETSQHTTMSFIVRGRTGFTAKLNDRALASTDGIFTTRCLVEGPYGGGLTKLDSYGTVMLVAGGVGITQQLPHVRHLVASHAAGTVAAQRVILVWIVQSPEHLEWIRPWMTEILGIPGRRDVLRVMLFVTRPRSTKEIRSPSATVQMFPGRPDMAALLDMEAIHAVGAVGVSVCGSGSLSDDVRAAVRARQQTSAMDFVEESYSW